jgi:hypothetical protein
LLAWRVGTEWRQANLRYAALAGPVEPGASGLPVAAREEPLAVEEIAANNLFSSDRNNEVAEPESKPAGPPPPRPIVLGTLKLGENYEALMSESESSRSGVRRVKQGDQVGEYRVVEIRGESVLVEYEGQTTRLNIYQSARTVAQQGTRTTPTARPTGPVVVETGSASQPAAARTPAETQPSAPRPAGREVEDPNAPPGTRAFIEGNRRRVERQTPFGVQTWYEPLEKQ